MLEENYLFDVLVPKQFYLPILILYFDFLYQKIFIKYPFFKKVFSNKTRLQSNENQKNETIIHGNSVHINTIIKLTKALTVLLLTRGLILTLISSKNDVLETLVTCLLSLIATSYIAVKCVSREKLSTILRCSINTKDRLKIVIQSDILLSFNQLILFHLKQYISSDQIGVLVFVNSYIVSIRFLQCIRERNWLNVLKYGLNYPILYCQYHNVDNHILYWFKVVQALYSTFWDLFMDWKLHTGISNRVLNKKVICILVVVGIVLKFTFLYKIYLNGIEFIPLTLEINRRLIWVLLRLDYEYLAL
ncbi:hypothetical protein HANVADRAFT_7260 [Hanseniaspora valbyensis NRRL Y-1626]|uniref:EXS domain-containing protein n=1 Tax=Hanseniaspora valbyensis NRRL Y-1626 TaxID=766949 RepID=A0A1B7TC98_9ASCO|nr:hypothetical protein HANVADRAFT_7260 [Hanseniaspora valbyensis NRRL Y-1626]